MELNETLVYPVRSIRIGPSAQNPSVCVVQLGLEPGQVHVAMTRQMMLDIAKDLREVAEQMPDRQ